MRNEDQPARVGRPCATCTHADRSGIEGALLDGEALTSVSSEFNVTRQSLRRHQQQHMAVVLQLSGVSAYDVVLRLTTTADRLKDLADQAEEQCKVADAVRASLAEAKTLNLLLGLGIHGQREVDYAGDAAALEAAVAQLVRTAPELGVQLAAQLESQGRDTYASKLRGYADRCRALPEHQPQPVSINKELTHAVD